MYFRYGKSFPQPKPPLTIPAMRVAVHGPSVHHIRRLEVLTTAHSTEAGQVKPILCQSGK